MQLAPGQTAEICLPITDLDLAFYEEETQSWKLEPGDFVVRVGASAADIRLEGTCRVEQGRILG